MSVLPCARSSSAPMMSTGTGDSPTERGAARVPTTAIFSTDLTSASWATAGIATVAPAATDATSAARTACDK